jgi:hypothetical protein
MNVVLCDGGLGNRLNALLFALVLKAKYGHPWEIAWPLNNWCGAAFEQMFVTDLPVTRESILDFRERQNQYKLLMHENQCDFDEAHITFHRDLVSYADYEGILHAHPSVLYFHHLLPGFVSVADLQAGLSMIGVESGVRRTAEEFCRTKGIDQAVFGLHIRKTDFGATVDDDGLFKLVETTPHRYFVCSDDREVNSRFAALPNAVVFEKRHFPAMAVAGAGWNQMTRDAEGRVFPFNVTRSADSIVEALIDLLILSRTTLVQTSHSTFLRMAMMFKACNFF